MFCYCLRKGTCCIANAVDGTEDDYLTEKLWSWMCWSKKRESVDSECDSGCSGKMNVSRCLSLLQNVSFVFVNKKKFCFSVDSSAYDLHVSPLNTCS